MKKLFLKNGMEFPVIIQAETKIICLCDFEGNRLANISQTDTVFFPQGVKNYELLAIAEIIENFNQYFNNLNQ